MKKFRPVFRKRLTLPTTASGEVVMRGAAPRNADEAILERGDEAWAELQEHAHRSWPNWVRVGKAIVVLKQQTALKVGQPSGKRFEGEFKRAVQERYPGFDPSDRNKLIRIMDNLDEFEAWRVEWLKNDNINAPSTLWRVAHSGTTRSLEAWKRANSAAMADADPSLDKGSRRDKDRLDEIKWQRNLTVRASNARGLAKMGDWLLDGPPDPLWIQAAREAAQAWSDLADRLQAIAASFEEAA